VPALRTFELDLGGGPGPSLEPRPELGQELGQFTAQVVGASPETRGSFLSKVRPICHSSGRRNMNTELASFSRAMRPSCGSPASIRTLNQTTSSGFGQVDGLQT